MTDDGIGLVLVLLHEVVDAREGYLIDIAVNLVGSHTDTAVADGERTLVLIQVYMHGEVTHLALEITLGSQGLQLLGSVYRIGNHFTKEDLVIRIEELLDDREYVLCRYSDITFLHSYMYFIKFRSL